MPLVVGVDSSTSACKVEVRDAESGDLVSSGRAPHPAPRRNEQEPAGWWAAFEVASGQAGVFDRHRPAAISVAAQQHGLVVLDAGHRTLRPAKLWSDVDSAEDSVELIKALDGGAAAWAAGCGSVPVASFTITKLRWLRRTEPDVYRKVRHVLLPHDWLTLQLTGATTTDRGDASGTGWWSPVDETYRPDLLALVDESPAFDLPEVLGPTQPAGRWPSIGALVGPGTGDNMAAGLGLGLRSGDMALSFGTSATAFCVSEQAADDATGSVAGFADASGRYLPLVCSLNATKVTDGFARLLGVDAAEFDGLALTGSPGADGVVLVPHLDGERTPNRPEATGTLLGIRSDTSRASVARAAVEGVVCNLLEAAERLSRWATPSADGHLFLIGGGSRSAAYRQVTADLTGRAVEVVEGELVARGAALQAAAALSGRRIEEVQEAWPPPATTTIEPSAAAEKELVRQAYAEAARQAIGAAG